MRSFAFIASALAFAFTTSAAVIEKREPALAKAPQSQLTVYWGQGPDQGRLQDFCRDSTIDIIPIGFVTKSLGQGKNGYWETNYANACDPPFYKDSAILNGCYKIEEDIKICQAMGKKVLVSIGGDTPQQLKSTQNAQQFAEELFKAYGPKTIGYTGPRPFGDAVVDGFDIDIEKVDSSKLVLDFAKQLRSCMSKTSSRTRYLSGAPQCVVPDAQLADAIAGVQFDFLFIQFYNTPSCSARAYVNANGGSQKRSLSSRGTGGFSWDDWGKWLQAHPTCSNTKLFLGLPAGVPAVAWAPDQYLSPDEAKQVIEYVACQSPYKSLYAGVMLWEATYSKNNQLNGHSYAENIRDIVDNKLSCGRKPVTSTTTTVAPIPTKSTTPVAPTSTIVPTSSTVPVIPTSSTIPIKTTSSTVPVVPTSTTTSAVLLTTTTSKVVDPIKTTTTTSSPVSAPAITTSKTIGPIITTTSSHAPIFSTSSTTFPAAVSTTSTVSVAPTLPASSSTRAPSTSPTVAPISSSKPVEASATFSQSIPVDPNTKSTTITFLGSSSTTHVYSSSSTQSLQPSSAPISSSSREVNPADLSSSKIMSFVSTSRSSQYSSSPVSSSPVSSGLASSAPVDSASYTFHHGNPGPPSSVYGGGHFYTRSNTADALTASSAVSVASTAPVYISSKPVDPVQTRSTSIYPAPHPSDSSTHPWYSISIRPAPESCITTVTKTTVTVSDICSTGFTTKEVTLTKTLTLTRVSDTVVAPWPTKSDGCLDGMTKVTTVCTVCGAQPTTVTLTVQALTTIQAVMTLSVVPVPVNAVQSAKADPTCTTCISDKTSIKAISPIVTSSTEVSPLSSTKVISLVPATTTPVVPMNPVQSRVPVQSNTYQGAASQSQISGICLLAMMTGFVLAGFW